MWYTYAKALSNTKVSPVLELTYIVKLLQRPLAELCLSPLMSWGAVPGMDGESTQTPQPFPLACGHPAPKGKGFVVWVQNGKNHSAGYSLSCDWNFPGCLNEQLIDSKSSLVIDSPFFFPPHRAGFPLTAHNISKLSSVLQTWWCFSRT